MSREAVSEMNNPRIAKKAGIAVCIVALMLARTVLGDFFEIKGVVPDFIFAFSLAYASRTKNLSDAVLVAFAGGVVSDFLCHSSFSGYCGIYTYSAVAIYFFKNLFIKPNVITASVMSFILFTLGKSLGYAYYFLCKKISIPGYFESYIIPAAFYDMLCFVIFYAIMGFFTARREAQNERI